MTRLLFWIATLMGCVAIVLAIFNVVVTASNHSLRGEANGRAQFVQQSTQLELAFNDWVHAMSRVAIDDDDQRLKALTRLAGITPAIRALPADADRK